MRIQFAQYQWWLVCCLVLWWAVLKTSQCLEEMRQGSAAVVGTTLHKAGHKCLNMHEMLRAGPPAMLRSMHVVRRTSRAAAALLTCAAPMAPVQAASAPRAPSDAAAALLSAGALAATSSRALSARASSRRCFSADMAASTALCSSENFCFASWAASSLIS